MFENYIFDLGHVLTPFDAYALTRVWVKDEEKVKYIAETVFDRLYWDRLDAGTITDDEVIAGFSSRLEGEDRELGKRVYDTWIENLVPIPGMPELIADIKAKGKKVFLLSNTSVGLYEGYHRNPWMKELFDGFDGLVISGVIRLTKPNREIYDYILTRYSLDGAKSIFIDDNAKNIEGCRTAGITGYLFDGDENRLRTYLGI